MVKDCSNKSTSSNIGLSYYIRIPLKKVPAVRYIYGSFSKIFSCFKSICLKTSLSFGYVFQFLSHLCILFIRHFLSHCLFIFRPWAALPHSPIATTPPGLPSLLQAPQIDSSSSTDEKADAPQTTDDIDVAKPTDKEANESSKTETDSAKSKTDSDETAPAETITSSSENETLSESKTSEPAPAEKKIMAGDTASVSLTNTEKDALKEPLPGTFIAQMLFFTLVA